MQLKSHVISIGVHEGPVLCAGAAAHSRLVEVVEPHRERLEPRFEQIPLDGVEVTVPLAPRE